MDIRENCVICQKPIVDGNEPVHEAPESGTVCYKCYGELIYPSLSGERARGREK